MTHCQLRACTLTPHYIDHTHSFHQVILATSGVTELCIEGSGERVTRERGCVIPSSYRHDYVGDGCNHTLVLDLPLAYVPQLSRVGDVARLFERPRFFHVPSRLNQLVAGLMPQVECQPDLHQEMAVLVLRGLYSSLHDGPDETTQLSATVSPHARIDRNRLDAYIDARLAQPIRVDELAALCALSSGHFHNRFRYMTGMTPHYYVQWRRLMHARGLLASSRLALGDIAISVGFRDQGSFSRAYRRHFGHPPSAERRH